jgi:hypothetical protein
MSKSQFSESQYILSYSKEITNRLAADFSMMAQHPHAGVKNIFIQYKMPKFYYENDNTPNSPWALFEKPFFSVKIDTDSEEHALLKQLSGVNSKAYYCCPEFHSQQELFNLSVQSEICSNSAIFNIDDIPFENKGYHTISYTKGISKGILSKKVWLNKEDTLIQQNPASFQDSLYNEAIYIKETILGNFGSEYNKHFMSAKTIVSDIYVFLLSYCNIHWFPYFITFE